MAWKIHQMLLAQKKQCAVIEDVSSAIAHDGQAEVQPGTVKMYDVDGYGAVPFVMDTFRQSSAGQECDICTETGK